MKSGRINTSAGWYRYAKLMVVRDVFLLLQLLIKQFITRTPVTNITVFRKLFPVFCIADRA